MLVTKQIRIDMGHRVPNHKSKCRNLHGHSYTIEVGVDDKVIADVGSSSEGMVIDFSDLKEVMMEEIHDVYDHGFVMSNEDEFKSLFKILRDDEGQNIHLVEFVPTAENLAQHWYKIIKPILSGRGVAIKYLKVWETPSSTATYGKIE